MGAFVCRNKQCDYATGEDDSSNTMDYNYSPWSTNFDSEITRPSVARSDHTETENSAVFSG